MCHCSPHPSTAICDHEQLGFCSGAKFIQERTIIIAKQILSMFAHHASLIIGTGYIRDPQHNIGLYDFRVGYEVGSWRSLLQIMAV